MDTLQSLQLLLLLLLAVCTLIYIWIKQLQQYWVKRQMPHAPETFYFWRRQHHRAYSQLQLWRRYKQNADTPILGIFSIVSPVVLVLDLDLIKRVLISDFDSFPDRGVYHNVRDDPLSANIFRIEGEAWKRMRSKLTPTFSSGRMKTMFPTVVAVAERFAEVLLELVPQKGATALQVRDLCARYTTDVIGSVAFGIECNSLREPHTAFRVMGDKAFGNFRPLVETLGPKFTKLFHLLHVRAFPKGVADFYSKIVTANIAYRERHNIKRNDFLDILIELKRQSDDGEATISLTDIIAQAFAFFIGGFETSSSTMMFCLYELSQNPEIQERARADVLASLRKNNNELTYECLKDMKYLTQVFAETLRKYPIAWVLKRVAHKNYVVPGTTYTIEQGTDVYIPVYAIHHDPAYYPEPEKFNPEHFSPAAIERRHAMAYLPFGAGPRTCIAERFGRLQTTIGLAMLLRHFKFTPTPETPKSLVFDKNKRALGLHTDIQLKVERV